MSSIEEVLAEMVSWGPDWNDHICTAPREGAIVNAKKHACNFRNEASAASVKWCEPYVTASSDGEPVFEWWYGPKKLTIYFQENNAAYVKVWGSNLDTEMEGATLVDFLPLLIWLTT